jgi:hypothetical protein
MSDASATAALARTLRRTFLGSDCGMLQEDLASALIEAALDFVADGEEWRVDLNDMFGLQLREPRMDLPIEDGRETFGLLAQALVFEHDIFAVVRHAARTRCADRAAMGPAE